MASALKKVPDSGKVAVDSLGTNILAEVSGNILTLRIDLSERHGKSSSGKTTIVATTAGNKQVPGSTVVLGLNAYVKE